MMKTQQHSSGSSSRKSLNSSSLKSLTLNRKKACLKGLMEQGPTL